MGAQLRKLTQCVSSTGHQHADNDEMASESDAISPLIEDTGENAHDDVTESIIIVITYLRMRRYERHMLIINLLL